MKLEDFINKYGNISVDENELKELLGVKDEKYFIPKENELYYYVYSYGEIDYWENEFDEIDGKILENNDIFATKEEAEEHARKQRFLLQMKRDFLDNSDEIDWGNDDQMKYYLTYDHSLFTIVIDYHETIQPCTTYATTNRAWLGLYILDYEEEIEKYYFEIEEKKQNEKNI